MEELQYFVWIRAANAKGLGVSGGAWLFSYVKAAKDSNSVSAGVLS
jgi:hypothetical protein